jgi:anti-sigma-K factor RskA
MIDMTNDDFTCRAGSESAENDREWSALRYVLGEMSPAEADAFEEILATDQETRELVARSTGLVTNLWEVTADDALSAGSRNGSVAVGIFESSTARVRPADPAELVRRRSERFRGWAITGLVAAVCCCVAIGLCLIPLAGRTSLDDIYSGDLTDNGAGHLVAIWSQRLADLAPETATTEPAASERSELPLSSETDGNRVATATENAAADSAAIGDQMAAEDADVPDWMVAAVEVGEGRNPDGSSSLWEN